MSIPLRAFLTSFLLTLLCLGAVRAASSATPETAPGVPNTSRVPEAQSEPRDARPGQAATSTGLILRTVAGPTRVQAGKPFTITPHFLTRGATLDRLYVVVNLTSLQDGQSGALKIYYNQSIPSHKTASFPLTAESGLEPGTYYVSVMIFPEFLGNTDHARYFDAGIVTVQ